MHWDQYFKDIISWSLHKDSKRQYHFPITLQIFDDENQQIGALTYELEIVDTLLPPLDICTTGWFHGDCLSEYYKVEHLSERHFEIMENFIKTAAEYGMTGNLVAGANIAGFMKVANSMLAYGIVW